MFCSMPYKWIHTFFFFPISLPHPTSALSDRRRLKVRSQRQQWHPTPVLQPRKSHGRRSLVCCSPSGCYQSDTTERLHFHFSLSHIGEGNGNPLQCSCHLWDYTGSDMTEVTQQQQQRLGLERLSNFCSLLAIFNIQI